MSIQKKKKNKINAVIDENFVRKLIENKLKSFLPQL